MKKNQIILISILLAMIVIINYFIFTNRGSKKPVELNPSFYDALDQQTTTFTNIKYSGIAPTWAINKLPLLTIEEKDHSMIDQLSDYCQVYENQDNYYSGNLCDVDAFSNIEPLEVYFHHYSASEKKINQTESVNTGLNFLQNFYPTTTASLSHNQINYFQENDYSYVESTPQKANLAKISYNYAYQQIPILAKANKSALGTVLINADNEIAKAYLSQKIIFATPLKTEYQLLNIEQALANIEAQQAYLLDFNQNRDYLDDDYDFTNEFDPNYFISLNLQKVQLEYRYDHDGLAIPVYHFSGTGIDLNQNELSINIITPAINFTVAP